MAACTARRFLQAVSKSVPSTIRYFNASSILSPRFIDIPFSSVWMTSCFCLAFVRISFRVSLGDHIPKLGVSRILCNLGAASGSVSWFLGVATAASTNQSWSCLKYEFLFRKSALRRTKEFSMSIQEAVCETYLVGRTVETAKKWLERTVQGEGQAVVTDKPPDCPRQWT